MLKRLIEVALPLKEISEHSAQEKSIRHGHISTLHIWWARRPLAACRAAVFASLIPDPDDPECPEAFRKLVMDVLGKSQFQPRNGDGSSVEDTPRNRCLEFIKHLVRWENSNNHDYIEPARKLIAIAHKFLHPDAEGDAPKVLDPFAGGGAIPLEALRLGCESYAIDINPVTHLIQLCTLVYPQKYGQPDSRPVPEYIKRLIAYNRAKLKSKGDTNLFDENGSGIAAEDGEIIPDVELTEEEYRKNPLASDLKYWAAWVEKRAIREIGDCYPASSPYHRSVAYIWARTIICSNPTCKGTIPLGEAIREVHERTRHIWPGDDYPVALETYLALCLTNLSHYLCTSATWLYEHMISSFILGGNIPTYYDQIPYAECADFFYVWLRRILGEQHSELFRTPLVPKADEIIEQRPHKSLRNRKDKKFYETKMREAFTEVSRAVRRHGMICVMFAHKSTTAWETLIEALLGAKLFVTASWPMHTERAARLRASNVAALASSVTLVCRNRGDADEGLWDDVRQGLKDVTTERLDFFWDQGIRGADFFISAIGPALSVFGKYERVTKLSGEEVTVRQFLDEVRSLVTNYALTRILHTTHTAAIDPESRFYVVWQWSYGNAKVPADESFKLSQALGMHTEEMWDRTGVLEKSGENVQVVPIAKRMMVKSLGEPSANGTQAGLIDVLHRLCAFREKGDTQGMAQFLGQSGHANNPTLWLVAQAISEILPDGDKEKQLMQGLLNQREGLEEATRQRALF